MDRSSRKNNVVFLLFFVMSTTLFAGSDEELFLRGNNYYKEGNYDKALVSYEGISSKGRASLYNMANCFYHKGEYAHALIYWIRSERGASHDERDAIARNKEFLLKAMGKPVNKTFLQKMHVKIADYAGFAPLLFLQIIFLLLWYLFVLLLYMKRKNKVVCISMLICLMCVGLLLQIKYKESGAVIGIIMKEKVSLYSGPNVDFHVLGLLSSAESVVVADQKEGWYKVQYANVIGWVEADSIQTV